MQREEINEEIRKQKNLENETVAKMNAKPEFKTAPATMKLWAKGLPADSLFMALVFALLAIGLVMVFSASFVWGFYQNGGDSYFYIKKQLGFAIIGVVTTSSVLLRILLMQDRYCFL